MNKKQFLILGVVGSILIASFVFAEESAKGDDKKLYPVRWIPEVKIKDLKEVNSLFDKPLDMSRAGKDHSLELTDGNDENKRVKIATCKQYFKKTQTYKIIVNYKESDFSSNE